MNATESKQTPQTIFGMFTLTTILFAGIGFAAAFLLAAQSGFENSPFQIISKFLALDSVHIWWYITRSAGLMSYLLVWLSTLWGFAISSKILDPFLERVFTYDFHEHLSLLGLGFTIIHAIVLLVEKIEPLSLSEILIPFESSYRPFWTGIGIIGFYLSLLVTVTFYIRSWISMKAFRVIHYLSIAAYLGALFHGLYAGTDATQTWAQIMYWGSFLSTVLFGGYWAAAVLQKRESASSQSPAA